MSPTDACATITSTFGAANRSRVAVIGPSSSKRVRGSYSLPVTSRTTGAPGRPRSELNVRSLAGMAHFQPVVRLTYEYMRRYKRIYAFVKRWEHCDADRCRTDA